MLITLCVVNVLGCDGLVDMNSDPSNIAVITALADALIKKFTEYFFFRLYIVMTT